MQQAEVANGGEVRCHHPQGDEQHEDQQCVYTEDQKISQGVMCSFFYAMAKKRIKRRYAFPDQKEEQGQNGDRVFVVLDKVEQIFHGI